MNATYTKLRSGAWGVRVEGTVSVGQTVTVTTKAGAVKTETISQVVWQGNGITLAAISPRSTSSSRSTSSRRRNGGREDCRKYGWDGVYGSSSYYTSGQYDEDS